MFGYKKIKGYTLLAALQAYIEAGNNSKEVRYMHYNGIYPHEEE